MGVAGPCLTNQHEVGGGARLLRPARKRMDRVFSERRLLSRSLQWSLEVSRSLMVLLRHEIKGTYEEIAGMRATWSIDRGTRHCKATI